MNVLVSMVGLVIYAYYADIGCDPLRSKLISNSNQVHCIFVSIFFWCLRRNACKSFCPWSKVIEWMRAVHP